MTLLPHDALSSSLTQYLYKISWDLLMRRVVEVTDVINTSLLFTAMYIVNIRLGVFALFRINSK